MRYFFLFVCLFVLVWRGRRWDEDIDGEIYGFIYSSPWLDRRLTGVGTSFSCPRAKHEIKTQRFHFYSISRTLSLPLCLHLTFSPSLSLYLSLISSLSALSWPLPCFLLFLEFLIILHLFHIAQTSHHHSVCAFCSSCCCCSPPFRCLNQGFLQISILVFLLNMFEGGKC